jgi:hypothetical protein
MALPLVGVWELMSDEEKAIRIYTETHAGAVFERTNTRRGMVSTYTVNGNRIHHNMLIDTATDASPQTVMEFQIDEDIMISTLVTGGTVSPVGHVDRWRKIAEVTMISPFAGVWELISETDQSINVRTDTYFVTIAARRDIRRGLAGTFTVQGNRLNNEIAVDTALNAASQVAFEGQIEGETLLAKRLGGSVSLPPGHVDRWRKIA